MSEIDLTEFNSNVNQIIAENNIERYGMDYRDKLASINSNLAVYQDHINQLDIDFIRVISDLSNVADIIQTAGMTADNDILLSLDKKLGKALDKFSKSYFANKDRMTGKAHKIIREATEVISMLVDVCDEVENESGFEYTTSTAEE